ncbi:hypothetical protein ATKI12_9106 [Kitasatospora sp. Ki12]
MRTGQSADGTDPAPLALPDAFTAHARTRPDAPAPVARATLSYGELATSPRPNAEDRGPGPGAGEPVGVLAVKSPEAIALVLACLTERRPFLLPSPQLAPALLAALFAQAGARRVLAPLGQDAPALPALAQPRRCPTLAAGTSSHAHHLRLHRPAQDRPPRAERRRPLHRLGPRHLRPGPGRVVANYAR